MNGFGWKLDEIIGAQILSVSMALPFKVARDAYVASLIILAVVFAVVFAVVNLLMHFLVVVPIKRVSAVADAVSLGGEDIEHLAIRCGACRAKAGAEAPPAP